MQSSLSRTAGTSGKTPTITRDKNISVILQMLPGPDPEFFLDVKSSNCANPMFAYFLENLLEIEENLGDRALPKSAKRKYY